MYLSSFFSLSLSLSFSLFFVVGQVMISHHSSDLRESRFSRSFLKFHFSISSHFYSTFTRSRFLVISISLSFLEKSEREKNFTIFFLEKRVKFDTKFHKKNYHSRRVRTQKKVCQEWFFNSRKFSIILEKFHFSVSKLFHFTFISWSRSQVKEWMAFFLHFSLLGCPKPTLAGHCITLIKYLKGQKSQRFESVL